MTRKRKKPGPNSYVEDGELPRRAGVAARKQFRRNSMKAPKTMHAYRAGFQLMHRLRLSGKYLARIQVKAPGQYNPTNQHKGVMWAMPNECSLTGSQAATVLEKCYDQGVTEDQLKLVRKSLAYAYELTTGRTKENYPEVKSMFGTLKPENYRDPLKSTKPEHVPSTSALKKAWTTAWDKTKGISLAITPLFTNKKTNK